MKFEIGKYYQHGNDGSMMFICGVAETTTYGSCLVAESNRSADLIPVGRDEDNAINWREISREQWMENFSND